MLKYMLDTDTSSYLIKGTYPELDTRVLGTAKEKLCISVITRYELLYGLELKPNATTLKLLVKNFLQQMTSLPFDNQAAASFAIVSAELRLSGIGMGAMDAMIASHALAINAIVVTNNVKHFSVVPRLKVENWIGMYQ